MTKISEVLQCFFVLEIVLQVDKQCSVYQYDAFVPAVDSSWNKPVQKDNKYALPKGTATIHHIMTYVMSIAPFIMAL